MRGWIAVVMLGVGCGDELVLVEPDPLPVDDTQPVTLQFHADAVDLGGLPVYFQAADSRLVLATRTLANGRATAFLPAGGFVTLALPSGQLWTYAGVMPGDHLVIDERSTDTTEQRTTFGLRVPPSPGADAYQLATACGAADITGAQDEMIMATLFDCGATTDLLVTTREFDPQPFGSNYRYLYRKDVVLAPGAQIELAGDYLPQQLATITTTGIPDGVTHLVVSQTLVRDGRDVSLPRTDIVEVTDSLAVATLGRMIVPPDGTTMTRVSAEAPGAIGLHHAITWGPSTPDLSVDLASTRLRSYATRPTFSASAVRWTEERDGALPDLALVELAWGPSRWTVLGPRGEDALLRVPVLPIAALVPSSDVVIQRLANVAAGDPGARTRLLGAWRADGGWPSAAASGRVAFEELAD